MKISIFINFLALSCISFAYRIPNYEIEKLKTKRSGISDDCKYISSLLWQKEKTYDCCNHERITCKNGHITEL